jgi:hypothetical protein
MKIYQQLLWCAIITVTSMPNSCSHRSREVTFRDLSRPNHEPKVPHFSRGSGILTTSRLPIAATIPR